MTRATLQRELIPLVAAAAVALAACGSSTTTSTATPSPQAAVCSSAAAVRASLQHLGTVDVVKQGTQGLQAALQDVSTNLHNLESTAGAALRPQTDALRTSLDQLETAVKRLGTQPSAAALSSVSTAVKNVEAAGQHLKTKVQAGCPSPTSS